MFTSRLIKFMWLLTIICCFLGQRGLFFKRIVNSKVILKCMHCLLKQILIGGFLGVTVGLVPLVTAVSESGGAEIVCVTLSNVPAGEIQVFEGSII